MAASKGIFLPDVGNSDPRRSTEVSDYPFDLPLRWPPKKSFWLEDETTPLLDWRLLEEILEVGSDRMILSLGVFLEAFPGKF